MKYETNIVRENWGTTIRPKDMISEEFEYRSVVFQRMNKDQRWYLTAGNVIINHGQYRHDLMEWVDAQIEKYNKF